MQVANQYIGPAYSAVASVIVIRHITYTVNKGYQTRSMNSPSVVA